MVEINIKKALSLIKEPNSINIAKQLIERFKVLIVDNIERLYSALYYSGKIDFNKINDKNKLIIAKAGIRHLSKESVRAFKELENRLIKDNLI